MILIKKHLFLYIKTLRQTFQVCKKRLQSIAVDYRNKISIVDADNC